MRVWPIFGLLALMSCAAEAQDDAQDTDMSIGEQLEAQELSNAYLPFARYALNEAAKRARGGTVSSAVLVPKVSLIDPSTIACDTKPLSVIIDLDVAPGTPAEMEIEPQSGFSFLLTFLRGSGIRIAWLAETSEARLKPITDLLREGDEPVMRDEDLILIGLPGSASKQDRRSQLARDYCVVAIAGDRKGDFDELYDYLRDQSYAIRLEAYTDRGWFLLPHPVAAIDSERLAISPEQKAEQ